MYGGYYATPAAYGTGYAAMPQAVVAPQQATPATPEIGNAAQISVSGCTHVSVGPIVRGNYSVDGSNHNKPAYRKEQKVSGLDVMLYYWDERDGPNFCGWWFGPKVGGDQVWAYHPSRQSLTPPTKGWKVPYDGPVDDSFSICPTSLANANAAQQNYPQGFQQAPGKGGGYQAPGAYAGQQPGPGAGGKGSYGNMPQNDQQRHELQAQNRRQHEQRRAMQRREEEMRQQQQAEAMRKAAEQKMQMEEEQRRVAEQKRKEQEACSSIRAVCQRMRMVQEESFPQLQQELYDVMQRELNNCGMQMAKIREECDQIVDQARRRLQEAAEVKAFQEKKKAEMLEAHKVACAKAEQLVADFTAKVEAAEEAANALVEKAEPFTSDESVMNLGSEDKILEEASKIDEARDEAAARTAECQEYLKENRSAMTIQDMPGQPPAEVKQVLAKVIDRLTETAKKKDGVMVKIMVVKSKAMRRSKAKKTLEDRKAKFTKYAKDGVLDKKQVTAYCKKEFNLALKEDAVARIFKALQVTKGVAAADFQRLRVQIGIIRESIKDQARLKLRLEREKELEASKEEVREKIEELTGKADEVEAPVKQVEDAILELSKVDKDSTRASQMHEKCAEVAAIIKSAQQSVQAVRKEAAEMREGIEDDLKTWAVNECKPLDGKCTGFERRIRDAERKHYEAEAYAHKKEQQEVSACHVKALEILKHHQKVKEMTTEDLVKAVAGDGETVTKENFITFFDSCEKEESASPPPKEDLGRYFDFLDDEKEGFLTQEHLLTVVRTLKKVTKETTITDTAEVSEETQTLSKLEVGDLLELLSEPSEHGDLLRARCRAMKDGTRGWVSVKSNNAMGPVFLQDGGRIWRVQKETLLTKGFDIGTTADEDRKLRPNELVGLREWMQKDEKSGLMRMKCKTKNDGKVGWVTAVGNTGTVFLMPH
mmetsp:Transcript_80861/g.193928  ORF Transcript_80861/g.193928 Transcript_80861/m.193928 type:complete len:935 (+) Transcript_80861:94-2898(+)